MMDVKEYATILVTLSLPQGCDIWDDPILNEIFYRDDNNGNLIELAVFASKNPVIANERLHSAHLQNPALRNLAIEYIASLRNIVGWTEIILSGVRLYGRRFDGFDNCVTLVKTILHDLDVALRFRTTFRCDHTFHDDDVIEHPIVAVLPVAAPDRDAVIDAVFRRLEDAGFQPLAS